MVKSRNLLGGWVNNNIFYLEPIEVNSDVVESTEASELENQSSERENIKKGTYIIGGSCKGLPFDRDHIMLKRFLQMD